MLMETFLEAEKIMNRIRIMEKRHEQYQDLIKGSIKHIALKTENGEMVFSNDEAVRDITYQMDSYFFQEIDKLKLMLDAVQDEVKNRGHNAVYDDLPREICDVCRQNKHSTYSDNLKQHMCEDCWDSYGEQCHSGLA